VTGPSVVTVSRATRTLSPEELDQAAQDCLRQQAPELAAQMEFTPTCATSRVMVPEGQVEIRAQASGTAVGALRAVRLTILADGQVVRTLTVRYRLRLEVEAPVAACSLSVGSALTPASWWVQRADAAALPGRPLRPQEMADRRMRRSVNAGAVLTTDNTEPIPLVIRGGKVMVVVHVGAIVLTCEGTAQADGAAGQSIAVQNPASKQVFEAVVIGPGRAEIRL